MSEHWTARFAKPILFLIVVCVAAGAYLATEIAVSVFPNTDFPRIVVGVDNGVMPIEQMQVTVTRPIEEALNTVPGLQTVRSTTSRGSAEVNLFFNWNVNMFQTLDLVNAAVARVASSLPATAKVTSNRLTFAAFPIVGYSLTSATLSPVRLWELANYSIKPRLNRVNGVSQIVVQGGQEPEFQIEADPTKLVQTQVTVPNILDALARNNLVDSPGLIENRHQLALALVSGQTNTPDEISDVVLKLTPAGLPVRVGDVATVGMAIRPVYTQVSANGRPAVLLNVFRQPDSNTAAVADAVHTEVTQIRASLPRGVDVQTFYDQSEIVRDSITSVRDAILIGLVLAVVIIVLFLRDWGSSLVAGLVIPATISITCIALYFTGQGFNLMTLGGLAAAVGLVIDDAIVVVENIVLHRQAGHERGDAIADALREIRIPLLGSTITPIVVFLPLVSIFGVTGTFFRALATTVAIALLTSLALALTWTPALSHYLLKPTSKEHSGNAGVMGRLLRGYDRMLNSVLDRRWLVAFCSLGLIGVSYLCYRSLGSDLLPAMDEGGFILDYLMPAGSSLTDTNRVISGVESILRAVPEVESTSRRTGLQLGLSPVTEANTGDISVKLKRSRSRGVEQVIADVRGKVGESFPMLDTEFIQVLQDMIGDLTSSPDPVEVKLFSSDAALLETWAPRVASAIKDVKGVVDLKNGIENTISGPAIVFRVDPATAARSGFSVQEAELDASAILQGEPAVNPVIQNDRAYTLRVRFPDTARTSLDAVKNTLLVSSTGRTATLGSLGTVTEIPGQTEVRRENLQRVVAVTARLEGVSLGAGVKAVQDAVARIHVPAAIRVEYGGTYAEQQRSFRDLVFVLVVAVILVFVVLLLEFRSFAAPIAILASALLSTSGVFLALLATGTTFNISSFMGLIMVIGIVAKNGVLLLDADQKLRGTGVDGRQAALGAGERRLRPILMTAMATIAGMIPLSLAIGAGSQMLQPLAISVIGGVLASMLLSLIVTPAVHYWLSPGLARGSAEV